MLRDWPALVDAALASDDEHVIKLVEAARDEESHYGGDDWRRAASRAVFVRRLSGARLARCPWPACARVQGGGPAAPSTRVNEVETGLC
ncbi:MAG: hypothetical protein U1F25_03595 [Rubrivivax sp.]